MHALIASLVAFTFQGGAAQTEAPQTETAGQTVSKMMAHYYGAKVLIGTIILNQRSGSKVATIATQLQVQSPNKVFLRQRLDASYGQVEWLVTSDGNSFTYDPPKGIEGKRLMESCWQNGISFTYRNVYQAVVQSLGDRSTPLDLVMGRREDLEYRRLQWATLTKLGDSKLGDVPVTVVGGKLRDYGKAPVSGQYEMYIDAKYQLLRYVEHESVAVKVNGQDVVQAVESVWDVNIAIDGTVDPALFKVIR